MADFSTFTLPTSTDGFGSNSYFVDLDGNGLNDDDLYLDSFGDDVKSAP